MSTYPAEVLNVVGALRRLGVDVTGVESQGTTHQLHVPKEVDARHAGKVLRRTKMRGVRVLEPAQGGAWVVQFELVLTGSAAALLPSQPAAPPAAPQELSPEEKQLKRQVAARKKEVRRQVRVAVLAGRTLAYSMATLLEANVGVAAIRKVHRKGNG